MAKGVLPASGELDEDGFGVEADADEGALAEEGAAAAADPQAEAAADEPPAKRPLLARARPTGVKQEVPSIRKVAAKALEAAAAGRTDYELFVERKRTESTHRDTACKAICKIKHGLRQPGAQEDGRPVMPEKWDTLYKPVLGSYIKFLLSRPDQFRIVEGSGPGFYTIEDVTRNRTVTAPIKGKDKGKGKGKKGKDGKGKGLDAKGKGKWTEVVEDGPRDFASLIKGAGKAKGKGAFKGKAKGKGPAVGKGGTPSRAAQLLAEAAREALAVAENEAPEGDEEMEAAEEDAIGDEGAEEAYGDEAEGAGEEELAGGDEELLQQDDEAETEGLAPPKEEDEDTIDSLVPKDSSRGSYLGLLFSGGLLSSKRPGAPLADAAKRAR